ncbi:MAG: VCBS repeat-containing protein [Candidatus Omnitrophica bacterium]|nr:VCBS repeat-containing protein [Candidatus Omnitrophota bacterium]
MLRKKRENRLSVSKKVVCVISAFLILCSHNQAIAKESSTTIPTDTQTVETDSPGSSVTKVKPSKPVAEIPSSKTITRAELIGDAPDATGYDPDEAAQEPVSEEPVLESSEMLSAMTVSVMATSDGGTSSTTPLPEKMINSFQFDPSSGSGVFSLPLYTSAGRKGMQPGVGISYSPRRGNGVLGFGWGIDFGYIERSTKEGVPEYDGTDTFIASLGGAMELVDIGGSEYQAKIESGFMKFSFDGTSWEAKDQQGNTYYFGLDTLLEDNSRVMEGEKVFRWYLSEVKDVHGNYYFVRHFANGGFEILYTGEPGTDRDALTAGTQNFKFRVVPQMDTVDREDIILNYRAGIAIQHDRRINAINVYADENLMRKYVFDYHYSSRTGRSLLEKITEYGADGITAMPAVTLTYQDADNMTYDISSVLDDPLVGDHLFNAKVNHQDVFHDNGPILYPTYGGNPDYGQFSSGQVIPWSAKITQSSYNDGLRNWNHGSGGDFHYRGAGDTAFYAWTWLYSQDGGTVNISNNGDVFDLFFKGERYRQQDIPLSLDSGYNLLQVTGYNQNDGSPYDLYTALANSGLVDLMNSAQVILPQLSGDFNGDGLADVATHFSSTGIIKVALSNGVTFLGKTTWMTSFGIDQRIQLGDFNADGKTDIASVNVSGDWRVALSNGSGFVDNGVWITGFGPTTEHISTGDMNGDGKTDIISFYDDGNAAMRVALNDGTQFVDQDRITQYIGNWYDEVQFAADFNGDGLTDLGAFRKSGGTWYLYLNPGNTGVAFPYISSGVNPFGADQTMAVADFNSDGMTDIGYYDYANGQVVFKASKGTTFGEAQTLPITFNMRASTDQVQSSDYNGDGLTDFIAYNNFGNLEVAFSQGNHADLLAQVDNGVGGTTSVTYSSSVHYPNEYLPFGMPLVSSMTVANAQGDSYTTQYSYEGGLWDTAEREFFGFEKVRVTDPEGNYAQTIFLQDDVYIKGRVQSQAQYALGNSNPYSKTINTWSVEDINTGVTPAIKFVKLDRTDNFVYDGDTTGRRTAQKFYYDESVQLGHLTKAEQLGEVELTTGADIDVADNRSVETTYLNNIYGDPYLAGLPNETIVRDGNNAVVHKTWFYYDNNADLNVTPAMGLLTKKIDWSGDGVEDIDPETYYTYTVYGNLETTTDPRGYTTSIVYDPDVQAYPLTTTNALGHTVVNEYYGINGVALDSGDGYQGLYGQVKSATDPNSQTGRRTYDTFGRLTATVSPFDSIDLPASQAIYEETPTYTKVTSKSCINHGQPETIDAVVFADGLGRAIQSKAASATAGQYVVSGQTEYNSRGLPVKKYLPYFTSDDMNTITAIDPLNPAATVVYDAMGRAVQSINPDGSFADVVYTDWKTESINANGHKQASYFDAYGRLVQKEEYLGADGRNGYYPAEPYTVYATTLYAYDSEGNLVQTEDAHNNITTIAYDNLSRKTSMQDPDMGYWQYGYGLNGNLEWQVDAKGQRIDFTYDELNRLVSKTDGADLNVNYTYDDPMVDYSKGRLTSVDYGAGLDRTEFYYDAMGREVRSAKTIGADTYMVDRSYDALGRLKEVVYPDGSVVTYFYNDVGQVVRVVETPSGGISPLSYLDEYEVRGTGYEDSGNFVDFLVSAIGNILDVALGTSPAYAQTTFPVTLEAEDMPTKTTGGSTSDGWNIWSNGYIEDSLDFNSGGMFEFEIVAKGSYAGGAWPNMELRLDQVNQASFTVNSSSWKSYIVELYVASGVHKVAAAFTNDYYVPGVEDRNLYVDKIIIRPVEAVAPVLTSHWRLDETSGNTLYDSSGNNYNGTNMGALPELSGKIQGALRFDGVSDYADMGTGPAITGQGDFCVAAWIKTDSNTGQVIINQRSSLGYNGEYMLEVLSDGRLFWWTYGDYAYGFRFASSARVNDGQWHHVVAGRDNAGQGLLYIDGALDNTQTAPSRTMSVLNVYIGADVRDFNKHMNGVVDDVRIYDHLLSNSDITALYNLDQDPAASPVLDSATADDAQVDLSWTAVSGATGYKVYYGTTSGSYDAPVDVGDVTSYAATGLTNDTTYYFVVTTYDGVDESTVSNELSATPVAPSVPPSSGVPDVPILNSASAGNGQATLSWDAVTGAEGYKVYYGTVSGGGVAYADYTADANCVAAWKFNEASGSVIDSCGVNNGIVSGGSVPQGVAGQYDQGIEFLGWPDGNNAYVNLGSDASLDNLANRTIVAWVNPQRTAGSEGLKILAKNLHDGWSLSVSEGNNIQFTQAFSGGIVGWQTITGAVQLNTFQHIAVTYAGTSSSDVPTIYLNGVAQAINSPAPWGVPDMDAAFDLKLGIEYGVGEFDGIIDEVGIFNRMLSGAEINELMDNGLDGTVNAHYEFEVDAGDVTSFDVTGLTNGTQYYFVVSAYNSDGESAVSDELSAVPVAPDPVDVVVNTVYNVVGQITRIEYGNGSIEEYTYDALSMRLTQKVTTDGLGALVQDLSYVYDGVGNIVEIVDAVGSANQSFEYDALGRLVTAVGESYGAKDYVYDEIGNLMEKDGRFYAYGENGAGPHAVTSLSDGSLFGYDENGNMTNRVEDGVTTIYAYDVENRLQEVQKNGGTVAEFSYDGDGGRTRKVIYDASVTNTRFVGSLFEIANNRVSKFIYLGSQRVAAVNDGEMSYYHTDHLGGLNVVTDADGLKTDVIEYTPFGSKTRHDKYGTGEDVAWHYFTGQRLDDEVGLYYYGARYYDPSLGRFITADTIVPNPSNSQTFNRYSYCHNNPVNFVDPTGHFAWFIPMIVAAVKGAIVGAAIGAGSAAIMGGDIGQGALFGAIGGAAFAGVSSAFTSFAKFAMFGTTNVSLIGNAANMTNIGAGVIGGAGAGAAGAAFLGSDISNGAGIGALSGGLFGGISGMKGTGWAGVGRVGLASIAGGGISEIAGGSFGDGAAFAGIIAGADFVYRSVIKMEGYDHGSSSDTADYSGDAKKDKKGMVLKVIHDPFERKSNVGFSSRPGEKGFFHETGAPMSWIGKNVPVVNGTSYFHDIITERFSRQFGEVANRMFFNVPSMLPSYGITSIGSTINDQPFFMGQSEIYGD